MLASRGRGERIFCVESYFKIYPSFCRYLCQNFYISMSFARDFELAYSQELSHYTHADWQISRNTFRGFLQSIPVLVDFFLAVCAGGRCWRGRPHPPPCTWGAWWACPAWAPPSSPSLCPGSATVSDIKACGTRSTTSGSLSSSTLVRYRLPSKELNRRKQTWAVFHLYVIAASL